MTQQTQGITMDSSIVINMAPAQVYEFWRSLENFPRFMKHINEVRPTQDNRYLWRVDGLPGFDVTWEADVTEVVKNERIAWRTVGDAMVKNDGVVRFKPTANGGTEVHVKLTYQPPAGKLGHAVATLFGMNPEQQMQDDLKRCKQILEDGITPEAVTRSDVQNSSAHKPH